ncbi:MAG: DUF1588 domain-containing protein [Pirellulaceae bacterium]|nr:DUF1588 domain-containing protein [Pirellulaceae bacterium]
MFYRVFLAILSVCSLSWAAEESGSQQSAFVAQSFLDAHCVSCHDGDSPEAGLSLSRASGDFEKPATVQLWQRVLEQIELGAMPPRNEPRPARADQRELSRYIVEQLARVGQRSTIGFKRRSPTYGNRLDHERLFDGSETSPAYSAARLWRLGPQAYDQVVEKLGPGVRHATAIHQPFMLDETRGTIADFAAQQFADAATLQLLMMNCETIAKYQTTGIKRREQGELHIERRTPVEFQSIVDASDPVAVEQIQAAVQYEFNQLLGRSPTKQEQTEYVDLFRRSAAIAGNVEALQTTLMAMMLQPEAIYRLEIGFGDREADGRRKLSPYELAFAIAYALTDDGPDQVRIPDVADRAGQDPDHSPNLLELAEAGKLSTSDDVERVVLAFLNAKTMAVADYRMFRDDHRIGNKRVLRFFREFFGYHHAPKVFKDAKRIGNDDQFHTERLVNDADQFVMHIFDQDQDVLRELLTSNKYFVAYLGSLEKIAEDLHYIKTNVNDQGFEFNSAYVRRAEQAGRHPIPIESASVRNYVQFYNLDPLKWDYPTQQPFPLPKRQRAGILMHPAWLIAWSGNFDNDPIRRGKWIREHLLADTIPDVPITVNAVVPEDHHRTLRDRLEVTRADSCWKCHQKMNPLGLAFEGFDDFGRHRDQEMLGEMLTIFTDRHQQAKFAAADQTGELIASGDAEIDGPVESALELVERLASSRRVQQSFVRHAFRFWMGRNETFADSPTLIAAEKAYAENGGSMKSLIASLLSSDSFIYRK